MCAHALVLVVLAATHPGEAAALAFIEQIKSGAPAAKPLELDSDKEFPAEERARLFRLLEKFISTNEWTVMMTEVGVVDRQDDDVTVYLRSDQKQWLVLLAGYHYDVKTWKVSAYESPDMSFKKNGQSFEAYVVQRLKEVRQKCGTPAKSKANKCSLLIHDGSGSTSKPSY